MTPDTRDRLAVLLHAPCEERARERDRLMPGFDQTLHMAEARNGHHRCPVCAWEHGHR